MSRLLSWMNLTFRPSFQRQGANSPFSQEESHLLHAVLQEHRPGRAPCHLTSSASISLYDYLVNFLNTEMLSSALNSPEPLASFTQGYFPLEQLK